MNLPLSVFRTLPLKLDHKDVEHLKCGIESEMLKRVDIFTIEREFAEIATEMVKTIVRELPLPKHKKTIPIVNAGGAVSCLQLVFLTSPLARRQCLLSVHSRHSLPPSRLPHP